MSRRLASVARAVWRPLLIVAICFACAALLGLLGPLYRERHIASTPNVEPLRSKDSRPIGFRRRDPRSPEPAETLDECPSKATRTCFDGDVWWFDGCGQREDLANECGLRRCIHGVCEADDPQCLADPTSWRCDGGIAQGCSAGRTFEVNCANRGERCVMTEEGPACRPTSPDDCPPDSPPRCVGDVLVACVEARWERLDCASVGAHCEATRPGDTARCVRDSPVGSAECGTCGCPPSSSDTEICDGRDNDADGFVDEDAPCPIIDLRPVFITDDDGRNEVSEGDLDRELASLNAWFARDDDWGLSFRWIDPLAIEHDAWLELDGREIEELLTADLINRPTGDFAIPIVFVTSLLVDGVPRPGLATPPNGACGGQRRVRTPQPPIGAVVIAKPRWPTTLAHELGHYLGLCHTHMEEFDTIELRADPRDPDARCDNTCALEGDGICDTPVDPGPESCHVDEACSLRCDSGERPDPANIMAYYPDCRERFTPEQAQLTRRSLALRRAWQPCLADSGCTCDPTLPECPEGMSCRPGNDAQWRCGLDGPVVPGAPCAAMTDCGLGSICILGSTSASGQCARPCGFATPRCTCAEVPGIDVAVCIDDLHALIAP